MATQREEDYQAEDDARTLISAEAIKSDSKRMERAQAAAKKMLVEEEARHKAMQALAGAKIEYKDKPSKFKG